MVVPEKRLRTQAKEAPELPLAPKLRKLYKKPPVAPKFTFEEMMDIRRKTLSPEVELFKTLHAQRVDLKWAKKIFGRLATGAWNPEWRYRNEKKTFASFQKDYTRYLLHGYRQYLSSRKKLV